MFIMPSDQAVSKREYFFLNLSKFVVETFGTFTLGIFYQMVGENQAGMFFGLWIITIFGMKVSGAHYNPAITFS